jgi:hypothetical protein
MSKTSFEELLKSLVAYFGSQYQAPAPSPRRQEGRIGTSEEREAAKLIIDLLRSRGYEFYRRPPEKPVEVPEEDSFYSRQGRNLFIYVREKGTLIDLNLFPDELGLFVSESEWRITNRMAIVSDAEESSIDRAEVILRENGFKRWDHPEEILVNYFALGDFSVFEEPPIGAQAYGS